MIRASADWLRSNLGATCPDFFIYKRKTLYLQKISNIEEIAMIDSAIKDNYLKYVVSMPPLVTRADGIIHLSANRSDYCL